MIVPDRPKIRGKRTRVFDPLPPFFHEFFDAVIEPPRKRKRAGTRLKECALVCAVVKSARDMMNAQLVDAGVLNVVLGCRRLIPNDGVGAREERQSFVRFCSRTVGTFQRPCLNECEPIMRRGVDVASHEDRGVHCGFKWVALPQPVERM